jgi:hypothetical protein
MGGETQLSKWWRTESCRRAFERVKEAGRSRNDKLNDLKRRTAEKKAKLQKDADEWEADQ